MSRNETLIRCRRCILPEGLPGISLDAEGVCSFCRSHQAPRVRDPQELHAQLDRARQVSSGFDVLVPLSGGRDSTFVLYTCVRTLGLRALAMNFDNDFREPGAVRNIQEACSRLKVPLVSVSSKAHLQARLVANRIRQFWARQGIPRGLCDACAYGYKAGAYREAVAKNIPLIVWGNSSTESNEDVLGKIRASTDRTRATGKLQNLLDPAFFRSEILSLWLRIEEPCPGHGLLNRGFPVLPSCQTRELSLFDYVAWDRHEIKETIQQELGWQKPEGKVSTWRTDCQLHDLINHWHVNVLGCTKDAFGYSKMILENQMSREEALAQEEAMVSELKGPLPARVRLLLSQRIGLTETEIQNLERITPDRRPP